MPVEVDILEDSIFRLSPELLNNLLKDQRYYLPIYQLQQA